MKYIKIYENLDKLPERGDYVLMEDDYLMGASKQEKEIFSDFVSNNIGHIEFVNKVHDYISVRYVNVPYQISYFFRDSQVYIFKPNNIKFISKTKEDLIENYIMRANAKKYNI